jgi:hypothetical protein
VVVNGAEVIIAQILAALFSAAQAHDAAFRFETYPTRLVFAPFDFTGFVEVDNVMGCVFCTLHDAAHIFVCDEYDGFAAAVSTASTAEI